MKRGLISYVALLRGINVGGNGLVKMSDLRTIFEKMGFEGVRTYINSGNVFFRATERDPRALEQSIERILAKAYSFRPKAAVRSKREIAAVVKGIPADWSGGPERKCNVIFLRPAIDSKNILEDLKPKPGIEEVAYKPGVLYWSALTSDLTKSTMVKLSRSKLYQEMTVRNLNTAKKLHEIMEAM